MVFFEGAVTRTELYEMPIIELLDLQNQAQRINRERARKTNG